MDYYKLLILRLIRNALRQFGKRGWFREKKWIMADTGDFFGFDMCCEYLGVDKKAFRQYVNDLPDISRKGGHDFVTYVTFLFLYGVGIQKIREVFGISRKKVLCMRKCFSVANIMKRKEGGE